MIVNQALAEWHWPGATAIGRRLVGGSAPPKDGRWATVVGVVKDLRREGLDVAPILAAFIPDLLQRMDMTIRVTAADDALIGAIRQELRSIDRSLPVPPIFRAGERLSERLGFRRFATSTFIAFAVIALPLATTGLYASLAYQVALRRREIGIRSAPGAGRLAIVRMFVGKAVRLALDGVAFGVAGAAAGARLFMAVLRD